MFVTFLLCLLYPPYTFHDSDVFTKNLVVENVTRSSILDNFNQSSNSRFSRYLSRKVEVLTFITPWNSIGYNLTLDFGFKFSTVVPVWFQAVNQGGFKIGGEQDILPDWLERMRSTYPNTKIMPRVNFEIPVAEFVKHASTIASVLRKSLGRIVTEHKLHGLFLEFQPYFGNIEALRLIPSLISEIRKNLPRKTQIFADIQSNDRYRYQGQHLRAVQAVIKSLDAVFIAVYELPESSLSSVMALQRLISWSNENKVISKVIAGLPLFGFDFSQTSPKHVFANEVKTILETKKPQIKWMKEWREHVLIYGEGKAQHQIWYPSLMFLNDRFQSILNAKFAGFGFWELAQGMPYFFDLL
jgi:hypothetical protein